MYRAWIQNQCSWLDPPPPPKNTRFAWTCRLYKMADILFLSQGALAPLAKYFFYFFIYEIIIRVSPGLPDEVHLDKLGRYIERTYRYDIYNFHN